MKIVHREKMFLFLFLVVFLGVCATQSDSALLRAIADGNVQTVSEIIQNQDKDIANFDSALLYAVDKGKSSIVELLLLQERFS